MCPRGGSLGHPELRARLSVSFDHVRLELYENQIPLSRFGRYSKGETLLAIQGPPKPPWPCVGGFIEEGGSNIRFARDPRRSYFPIVHCGVARTAEGGVIALGRGLCFKNNRAGDQTENPQSRCERWRPCRDLLRGLGGGGVRCRGGARGGWGSEEGLSDAGAVERPILKQGRCWGLPQSPRYLPRRAAKKQLAKGGGFAPGAGVWF